jgi:hypothetical protein
MPFATQFERDIHFRKHGHKFGTASPDEYENMADAFMFCPMRLSMRECARANTVDRLRFNIVNRHFGAANIAPEFLKTFYPVPLHTVAKHGGSINYFAYECGRTDI